MKRKQAKGSTKPFSGLSCHYITGLLAILFVFLSSSLCLAGKRDYLVVTTWGGLDTEAHRIAYFDPFTKETGIEIRAVEAGSGLQAKMLAMQKSGNIEWDVITGDYEFAMINYYKKGLLEKIDYSIVTNVGDLVDGSIKKWGVGSYVEAYLLVYNTNEFKGEKRPKSWKDFFDVKNFPGPRAMHNWGGPVDNLAIAQMADGASTDEFYPVNYKRAFRMLDKIKPHVTVWFTSGDQLMQSLIDEEVVMAVSTDARAKAAIEQGAPIALEWNQAFYYLNYNSVVKNTPMKKEAMQLLNFMCRSDRQAEFTKVRKMTGSNIRSIEYLPNEIARGLLIYPETLKKVFSLLSVKNGEWTTSHMDEVDEKWNYWIAR